MDFSTLENRVLAGRFRLIGELGRGGFGAVFEAEQISVGRRCAVKLLSMEHSGSVRETSARFEQEARATSQLAHPNTVTIFDFGRDDETGLLFLAMEYLEGESLHQRIKRGPLDLKTVAKIVVQIAGSLNEAHQVGLVHRDIKPHNVMLIVKDNDPTFVKLIDFGIAKVMTDDGLRDEQITQTGTIIGTPAYMSPEQIEQAALDGRSDQYAVACLVYTMLSGKPPFHKGTAMGIATRHLGEEPVNLSSRVSVPSKLDRIVARALAKDPADRFPDIRAFANAFAEVAEVATPFGEVAEPVVTRRSARYEPTGTMSKNQRNVLAAAILLVLIGISAIGAVLLAKNRVVDVAADTPVDAKPGVEPEVGPKAEGPDSVVTNQPPLEVAAPDVAPDPQNEQPPEVEVETPVVEPVEKPVAKIEKRRDRSKKTVRAVVKKEPGEKPENDPVAIPEKEPSKSKEKDEDGKKPSLMWGME